MGTAKFITRAMAILGGLAAVSIVLLLEFPFVGGLTGILTTYLVMALLPAIVEEPFKQIGILIVAAKQPRWFTSKWDGVVAGALAGASFGIVEGIFYIISYGVSIGWLRILATCMHVGASAAGGLGMYYASKREYKATFGWLGLGMVIHFLWNFIAISIGVLLSPS